MQNQSIFLAQIWPFLTNILMKTSHNSYPAQKPSLLHKMMINKHHFFYLFNVSFSCNRYINVTYNLFDSCDSQFLYRTFEYESYKEYILEIHIVREVVLY